MNRKFLAIPFAVTAAMVAACNILGGPAVTPSPSPSASATPARTPDPMAVDVCGDLAESNNPLTAAGATDSAPALDTRHKRNRITLPASGSAFIGYVKFNSDKEGPWDILLTKNVAFQLAGPLGAITPSASKSSFPDCPELAAQYTVDLKLGTHYIKLGPTAETEVSIVTENGEEE